MTRILTYYLTEDGPLPVREYDLTPSAYADLERWIAALKERYQWPQS